MRPQDAVNVCCMGVNAQQDADVIRGFIEEELSDRRGYLTYAAMAPSPMARQLMRRLAAEEGGHARRLLGVYYLITGQVYCPAVPQPGEGCVSSWREVLRLRYHEESCGGRITGGPRRRPPTSAWQRSSRSCPGMNTRHARQVLTLLEKQMSI